MPVIENISVRGYVVPLVFQITNAPDATTEGNTVEATSPAYVMPFDGSIVAISVRHNGALSTGTLTFRPTVNGTENTGITAVTSSSAQQAYSRLPLGRLNFLAGQRIGAGYTRTGTVSPTTTDVVITVWVHITADSL